MCMTASFFPRCALFLKLALNGRSVYRWITDVALFMYKSVPTRMRELTVELISNDVGFAEYETVLTKLFLMVKTFFQNASRYHYWEKFI